MEKVKAHKLREKKKAELRTELATLRKSLAGLRVIQATGGQPGKLAEIKKVRKGIARVLTVMNQKIKMRQRLVHQDKKRKPIDLRHKLTRAARKKLTPRQTNLVSRKEANKNRQFPKRKYALRA